MKRRLDRIERLLRLRGIERDAASARHAETSRIERDAVATVAAEAARVERVSQEREDLQRRPELAGLWQAAALGQRRFQDAVLRALSMQRTAEQAAVLTREAVMAADRRVRALEKLRARASADQRRERAKQEQSRIDEAAVRGHWRRHALVAVCLLSLGAGDAGAASENATKAKAPPELAASFDAIRLRQLELDRYEREIQDRENQLRDLESAVEARLSELEKLSERVEARIAAWEETEDGKSISRLARIYSAMKPAKAAPLIAALDLELATQIISKMKPKQSSALFGLLESERARLMSERIAHPLSMNPAPPADEPEGAS